MNTTLAQFLTRLACEADLHRAYADGDEHARRQLLSAGGISAAEQDIVIAADARQVESLLRTNMDLAQVDWPNSTKNNNSTYRLRRESAPPL